MIEKLETDNLEIGNRDHYYHYHTTCMITSSQ